MAKEIFKIREWIANSLVRLAHRIRPRTVSQLLQSMEDQLIYGDGITRVDPKKFYKVK